MKRWLMKYLCCCCYGRDDDDDDGDATAMPHYEPPPKMTQEEIEQARARVKAKEEREKAERLAAEKSRVKTGNEREYERFAALRTARVKVEDEAEAALHQLTGTTTAEMIDTMLARLARKTPMGDNVQVNLSMIGREPKINVILKNPEADGDVRESWYRDQSPASLTARIIGLPGDDAYLYIDRMDAQRGNGPPMFCGLLEMTEGMGLGSIRLEATEAGRYAWIRYGFRPVTDGPKSWDNLRAEAVKVLEELADEVGDRELVQRARRLLGSPDPNTIEAVANLRNPVGEKTLGYRLVAAAMWEGVLDLTNAALVRQVKDYLKFDD